MSASVFITCRDREGDVWTINKGRLISLHEQSNQKHSIVDNPDSADIVIICDVRDDDWDYNSALKALIEKYPDKCFSISEQDIPCFVNRGIYTSLEKSIFTYRRARAGSYKVVHNGYFNPFIAGHVFSEDDYNEKRYLLSFIGRRCHQVRQEIFDKPFQRKDVLIEDSSSEFNLWGDRVADRQRHYYRALLRSKFALCPRGAGTSSFRLFESMQLGVAPVIMSDNWIIPKGPDWKSCSIFIKERHVREIEKIVSSHESDYLAMGLSARKAYSEYFSEEAHFNYIVENCIDLKENQLIPEIYYWKSRNLIKTLGKIRARYEVRAENIRKRVRIRARIRQLCSSWLNGRDG
ncbi:MAG: exostosin family protein [Pontixanthobacter sp.]